MSRSQAPALRAVFRNWDLDAESRAYLEVHARRYAALLDTIAPLLAPIRARSPEAAVRILDVGPGYQTELLRRRFPGAFVNTLGFEDTRLAARAGEDHYPFDLNDAQTPESCPPLPEQDLVVLAEVLEHLHTSPVLVLRFLRSVLAGGGLLVIQTPNACALNRRLKMLLGRNPMEPIRESRTNPGHFHEYTVAELGDAAGRSGFTVETLRVANYFDGGSWKHEAFNGLSVLLPPRLREGITAVLRKTAARP